MGLMVHRLIFFVFVFVFVMYCGVLKHYKEKRKWGKEKRKIIKYLYFKYIN